MGETHKERDRTPYRAPRREVNKQGRRGDKRYKWAGITPYDVIRGWGRGWKPCWGRVIWAHSIRESARQNEMGLLWDLPRSSGGIFGESDLEIDKLEIRRGYRSWESAKFWDIRSVLVVRNRHKVRPDVYTFASRSRSYDEVWNLFQSKFRWKTNRALP